MDRHSSFPFVLSALFPSPLLRIIPALPWTGTRVADRLSWTGTPHLEQRMLSWTGTPPFRFLSFLFAPTAHNSRLRKTPPKAAQKCPELGEIYRFCHGQALFLPVSVFVMDRHSFSLRFLSFLFPPTAHNSRLRKTPPKAAQKHCLAMDRHY